MISSSVRVLFAFKLLKKKKKGMGHILISLDTNSMNFLKQFSLTYILECHVTWHDKWWRGYQVPCDDIIITITFDAKKTSLQSAMFQLSRTSGPPCRSNLAVMFSFISTTFKFDYETWCNSWRVIPCESTNRVSTFFQFSSKRKWKLAVCWRRPQLLNRT